MGALNGSLNGQNREWSIDEHVGETQRWTTYTTTEKSEAPVAIRTPTGEIPSEQFDRFETLATQWAAVDDRQTVRTILDWGTDPQPWVAVEYTPNELESWTTGNALETARECDLQTQVDLLSNICETLRTYSRYGSTGCHLALHPDCLSFRVHDGEPITVVGDWGISRLVADPPTTPFTAPEQLDGDHASKRTDVYQIGALAAAILGDESIFPAVDISDPSALASAIRDGINVDAIKSDLPEGTARPISQATAYDPSDRYETTYSFSRDLINAVSSAEIEERNTNALVTGPQPGSAIAETDNETAESKQTSDDAVSEEDSFWNKPVGNITSANRRNALGIVSVCAVILLLAIIIPFGPALLGEPGTADPRVQNEMTGEQVTVAGVLIDNATAGPINSTTKNITVTVRNQNQVLNTTNQPTYNFSVNETQLTDAILVATADGYEEKRVNISEERVGDPIRLDPITPVDATPEMSRLSGRIINSNTSGGVSDATVVLTNSTGETIETTTENDGMYSFKNISYGEYTLSASATGFVTSENQKINVNSSETQVHPLDLDPTASMSILFIDQNTRDPLYGGAIQLIDTETNTTILDETKGASGWFNTTNLTPGTYRVELSRRNGYEDTMISITLESGDEYVQRVRVARTAVLS